MLAKVLSSAVLGIEAYPVEVEVDISSGLPAFNLVGLPDAVCRESGDRVRAALKNSGIVFPAKRITVNLAPADMKKEGAAYDLAIALGILVANENIPAESIEGVVFCGELSLDGRLRPISGVLPRAASLAGRSDLALCLPLANAREAGLVDGARIYAAKTLRDVLSHLKGERQLKLHVAKGTESVETGAFMWADFSDIRGQAQAKRGLEIAAAGRHHVLMIGPPGSGKTMLAKRLPGILSSMTHEESIETTKIHSVAGMLSKSSIALVRQRPFRDPHHTVSAAAIVGGGTCPKPGEVSLAHHGVLFLDELAEFGRNVLEVLRQPIESGEVTISRASCSLTFPSRFMLVAAMNPCPCGYFCDPKKECSCTSLQIKKYLAKISGPLLDRIDIQLHVPRLKSVDITEKRPVSEGSAAIRQRVERARQIQSERYRGTPILSNAQLGVKEIEQYCPVTEEGQLLLKTAVEEQGFSARAYHKCLKVARTLADLEAKECIQTVHVAEAIHYRALDKTSNEI